MIKKFLASVFIVAFLTGCSITIPDYDANEYKIFVDIKTEALILQNNCSNSTFAQKSSKLGYLTLSATVYSEYPSNNAEIFQSASIIRDLYKELMLRYRKGSPSAYYCKKKLENIITVSDKIMRELAGRRKGDLSW